MERFPNPPDLAQTFTGEDPIESVGKGRGPLEADWTKPLKNKKRVRGLSAMYNGQLCCPLIFF